MIVLESALVQVFIIPLHVTSMADSIMPAGFSGAYVRCYAPGVDYVEATKRALAKLSEDGLFPKEILQPILQMNAEDWSVHVSEQWPNQAGSLMRQDEFEETMRKGGVVYGPFGSYS